MPEHIHKSLGNNKQLIHVVNCYVVTLTMRYSNPNISPIIDSSGVF